MIILQEQEWQSRRARHEARVQVWIGPHLDRRFGGKKDPVIDFLFNYYSLRPAHLLRWTPGFGVVLAGAVAEEFLTEKFFVQFAEGVGVDVRKFPLRRLEGIAWALKLLRQTAGRPAQNACYGLHEWAMVY
ncbi:MAG: 3-methyladenine DNA glycosylase, partial [Verrucomicrobiae bacterium]|nr:3-methyladenine DNA glycosylase [Verrucomicrobiae bacterium]